ncbi:sensor histidine kinase [Nitriliruptor alkaliphilus]|uniref:sensor histidine kinase n=1 Tax=Nitriliruptor alkaliphilus TaxID=427918 RepID=UPI0009FA7518|nr:sensor histidine kinase [Nitriliruptor alkaliphilus]
MTSRGHERPGGRLGERVGLARQVLTLQVLLVLVTVVAAIAAAGLVADRLVTDAARTQVRSLAASIAEVPEVRTALAGTDPTDTLQPLAERIRARADVSFVVVMTVEGTRFTHPDPDQIGGTYIGTIAPAATGGEVVETFEGTLGPSVRAVVPVLEDGEAIGLVAVGVTVDRIWSVLASALLLLGGAAALALTLAALGTWGIARRLRRQTFGLTPQQLAREHAHHQAVLHAIREGLIVLDDRRRLVLLNDEARRLLDLRDTVATEVTDLPVDGELAALLASGAPASDEIHLAGDRLVVVNQLPVGPDDGSGTVLTMRDHTEVVALSDELGAVRNLAESLRAQAHEADNRLHTVVSLIELGEVDAAVRMATDQVRGSQELVDRLLAQVDEPELVALLLGKASQAHERGVDLQLVVGSTVGRSGVEPTDLVTILGNLIDNALDAVASTQAPRDVEVRIGRDDTDLDIVVTDTGTGLSGEARERLFELGWSTKLASAQRRHGRGIGMALVRRTVDRLGGEVTVTNRTDAAGAVARVRLPCPLESPTSDGHRELTP